MRVRLKGLNKVEKRLADGTIKAYYYAWKGGPRVLGTPGSPEFIANYNAAVASLVRIRDDCLASLITRYIRSPAFMNLKPATKKHYSWHLTVIESKFGDMPIVALKDRRVRADFLGWRDEVAERSPRQADVGMAVFARMLSWAYDKGIAPAHPLEKPGRIYRANRSASIWTEEHEAAFYDHAPQHLHLALMLALWTGQRRADLLALTWGDYDGHRIRLMQKKTGARVAVPVGAALKSALDAVRSSLELDDEDARKLPILLTENGTPWTDSGFGASWRKACKKAGVVGVTFHDLRGTAVTRLARAGCTVPEIASISGHSLNDVNEILNSHYLLLDDNLARSAIQKLEASASNRTPNYDEELSPGAEKIV